MEMEAVQLVPCKSIDGVEDVGGGIVITGDVHVKTAVGKFGGIDNAEGCIGAIYAGRGGGMLVEELSECIEGAQNPNAGYGCDQDGA